MPFYIKAQTNESIVLKTYGIPINIARSWSLIPFPCCQVAQRFNLGRCNVQFECAEVNSKDDIAVSLIFSAKYVVDRSTKTKIMKAYKDFFGDESKDNESDVIHVETKVLEIVYKIVKKHAAKLEFTEMIKFNWLFVDSIYTEIKYVLKDSSVILEELTMDEINECTKNETELVRGNDEKKDMLKQAESEKRDREDKESLCNLPGIVIDINENMTEDVTDNINLTMDVSVQGKQEINHVTNKTVHLKQVSMCDEDSALINQQAEYIPVDIESDSVEFDTVSTISIEDKSLSRQVSVLYKDDVPANFFIRGISVQYDNSDEYTNEFDARELNLPKPTVTEDGVICAPDTPSLIIKRKIVAESDGGSLINILSKENSAPMNNDECDNLEMYESSGRRNSDTKSCESLNSGSKSLEEGNKEIGNKDIGNKEMNASNEFAGYNLLLYR